MDTPEYLALFQGDGDISIEVKFKDYDGSVADLSMHADEIVKLIDPLTCQFYTEMRLNDWLFAPINKLLIFLARLETAMPSRCKESSSRQGVSQIAQTWVEGETC